MIHDRANWRMKTRRAALILSAAALPLLAFAASGGSRAKHHAHAQSQHRLAGAFHQSDGDAADQPERPGAPVPLDTAPASGPIGSTATRSARSVHRVPNARFSPNLYPACQYAFRGPDGECFDRPVRPPVAAAATRPRRAIAARAATATRRRRSTCARSRTNSWPKSTARCRRREADALARRHGLERIASQNFPLLGGTIGLFRIIDRRPVDTVRRELAADGSVRVGAVEFPLFPAGSEEGLDRGRFRAIRGRAASAAAGARARPRHERHHRGDQFRRRRQASRTRQFGCRHLRCARQQGRSACPRHRHRRRDRRACQADGQRAGGEDAGDPRIRRGDRAARRARPT